MAPLIRNIKNAMYTSTEAEVRNATSNEPCNTPVHELANIAAKTFSPTMFPKIMTILETRLNDKGKSWRHVLKSLQVLEYCLIHGSEATAQWCKLNDHYIRTLKQFVYMEDGIDVGANVRVAASTLTNLISDNDLLQSERQKQGNWKSRLPGLYESTSENRTGGSGANSRSRRRDDEEDLQMKLAIQASLNQAKEEEEKRRAVSTHDDDLAKALKLSQEEEEARKRQNQGPSSQQDMLINLNPPSQPAVMPQNTGWNQGYQQQGAVDWLGNPIDLSQQQQAVNTGYLSAMPQTMYNTGYMFANPTGMMPLNQAQMTGYLPQQPTGFGANNPYGQSTGMAGTPNFGSGPTPGTNNPWASPEAQRPQPTGSNNPFAPRSHNQVPNLPSSNTLNLSSSASSPFNLPLSAKTASTSAASAPPITAPSGSARNNNLPASDSHIARLNQLLSTGEGIDTFGNTGDLRIPVHHTSTAYVNSAGVGGGAGQLQPALTGANPFSQQFTGMPRATLGQTSAGNTFGLSGPSTNGRPNQDTPNLIDI